MDEVKKIINAKYRVLYLSIRLQKRKNNQLNINRMIIFCFSNNNNNNIFM